MRFKKIKRIRVNLDGVARLGSVVGEVLLDLVDDGLVAGVALGLAVAAPIAHQLLQRRLHLLHVARRRRRRRLHLFKRNTKTARRRLLTSEVPGPTRA